MKRRTFLKALASTLTGAAALPFVKLPENIGETKKAYEMTVHKDGSRTYTLHTGDGAGDGAHTHSLYFSQRDPNAHTHNVCAYDPNAPLVWE